LDERRNLVPPGAPGELYLGGDGVALGYLNQPQLNAERFIDLDGNQDRWYRTGDIVRWTSAGLIEFVGRADQQVKVHGFRIELGEIEAALVRCDSIKHATVIVAGEGAAKRLVAYLVPADPTAALDWNAIRTSLRQSLPEYMIPVQHVQLDRLPLNVNGKVDRRALPAPVSQAVSEHTAPASDLERTLADLWAQVLEIDQVGLDDNFFDLGGQSLLLVKLHERITRTLQIDLPVVDLFRFTTVRAQASHFASLTNRSTDAAGASSSAAVREAAARQREAMLRAAGATTEGRIA
jgi:non-ribosomal peptide synthetase component F